VEYHQKNIKTRNFFEFLVKKTWRRTWRHAPLLTPRLSGKLLRIQESLTKFFLTFACE